MKIETFSINCIQVKKRNIYILCLVLTLTSDCTLTVLRTHYLSFTLSLQEIALTS